MKLRRPLFLSLLLLTGFFYYSQTGLTVIDSIKSGGVYRSYRLYIPTSYNGSKAFPLVLNLHGLSSSATEQQVYSNFMPIADTANFLVVHPEGSKNGSTQYWNVGIFGTTNDVGFLNELIDSLSVHYTIDQNAVYSCGLSNGGIMSYYLVCNLPAKLAAIASVAGTMFRSWYFSCDPKFAIPVMEIHGTEDGTIPYVGNSTAGANGLYMPIDTVVQRWVFHNHCNPSVITKSLPDVNSSDFSTVINYKYINGVDKSMVELYKVLGGSHSWPGAIPLFFHTNEDFNASAEIWRFFRQFKRNQFVTNVGVQERETLLNSVKVFPNPGSTFLTIVGPEGARYSVLGLDGKKLLTETVATTIDISQLNGGLYFLKIEKDNTRAMIKIIKE
ncbi:MAG: T9SS type A sorting domain-containing protein [bacterium]|nr:T9SS type A sorting domain-containing protein [bacterium]